MNQRDSKFSIKLENTQKALDAIKSLAGKETITDSYGRHFSWVHPEYEKAKTLFDAMSCWRWQPKTGSDGGVDGVYFTGEKYGDDPILFKAIAPFVEDGSYIEMQGENGEIWRWVFNNGKFKEVYGRHVFEADE